MAPSIRVAACHISSVFLNAKETTTKCVSFIHEASQNGADLVVFPESIIPAFPYWSGVIPPIEASEFFVRMVEESVYIDGEEVTRIRNAARDSSIAVSIGISEKVHYSSATMFNANLIISSGGDVLVHHRKIMPTFVEKLTWSPGDGHGLQVVDLDLKAQGKDQANTVKLGALICGENTNPLARYTMIAQGEQIHITTWPAKGPKRLISPKDEPLQDADTPQANGIRTDTAKHVQMLYDNVAVNRTRAAEHSFEGKCFSIMCAGYMSSEMISKLVSLAPEVSKGSVESTLSQAAQAETLFLDPSGKAMLAYTIESGHKRTTESLRYEEGILYADMDTKATIEAKQYQDIVGSYQRFDIFKLTVDRSRRPPVTFIGGN